MKSFTPHPTPRWNAVVTEQLWAVWIGIRGAVGIVAILTAVTTLFVIIDAMRFDEGIPVGPEMAYPAVIAAMLFPIVVWKGGYHFRRSYLATMPVGQQRHVMVKVAAGWIWLMVLTGVFLLSLLGIALATGGQIGVDEVRVIAGNLPRGISAEEAPSYASRWTTPDWQWALFFTGSTAAYLAGSAIVLASRRTRLWLAGAVTAAMLVFFIDDEVVHIGGFAEGIERCIELLLAGPYGLTNFLTIDDGYHLTTAAGENVSVWSTLPSVEQWLVATLLWIGFTVASVVAVVWFDRKD